MRIVGYVREAISPAEGDTAYAQGERIRRWVADTGNHLIAVCSDTRAPVRPLARDGFKALLHIARSGDIDAVVVADLDVLSPDKVAQEIMLQHLRSMGLTVVSTSTADHPALASEAESDTRLVVRDVVAKVRSFQREFGDVDLDEPQSTGDGPSDVIVELIPAPEDQGVDSAAHTARPTA